MKEKSRYKSINTDRTRGASLPGWSLLKAEEVAEILKVSPSTVYEWRRTGQLPGVQMGTSVRFTRADVEAFVRDRRGTSGRRCFQ
jgi:excisionase family DNA binding protein